jgi:vibriolysin
MKTRSTLFATVLALASQATAAVVINEIDYDNVGTDTAEFVELYNNGSTQVDISGYVLALFNGSNNTLYSSVTIPAATILSAGSYYIIGGTGLTPKDLSFAAAFDNIQNGAPDAVGLYSGGSFATGNPSTTNSGLLLDGINYEATESQALYPGFSTLPTTKGDSNALNYSIGRNTSGQWDLLSAPTMGSVNAEAIPEPSTALLGALGFCALLRRRR